MVCISNQLIIFKVEEIANYKLKMFFYVYKSVCSKEPGESFTYIIKIPFCLKRRRRKPTTNYLGVLTNDSK
jgi:hypothetical protein